MFPPERRAIQSARRRAHPKESGVRTPKAGRHVWCRPAFGGGLSGPGAMANRRPGLLDYDTLAR
ncbi:hypothetical protein JD82_00977 [Prauserella rugosa]|uniref:Uncharacterized protein n=1 Tax=Prauserella rugosa TaxID=43354 RepID=A0A660C9Y1_9PSEU|nr:hypothetical protein JD82_00977 [Prauserella rugosa]